MKEHPVDARRPRLRNGTRSPPSPSAGQPGLKGYRHRLQLLTLRLNGEGRSDSSLRSRRSTPSASPTCKGPSTPALAHKTLVQPHHLTHVQEPVMCIGPDGAPCPGDRRITKRKRLCFQKKPYKSLISTSRWANTSETGCFGKC